MTQIVPSGLIERCLTAGVHEHKNSTVATLNAVLLEQLIESYRLVAATDPKPEARAKAQSRVMELEMRRSMLSPPIQTHSLSRMSGVPRAGAAGRGSIFGDRH